MNEIARIDEGNYEHIVYWDSEEKRPRIQVGDEFVPVRPDRSVQDTLTDVFGTKKRIGDVVVGRRYAALPFECTMVRDLSWKELRDIGMYVTFRIYS
jgi:hypothetical protein